MTLLIRPEAAGEEQAIGQLIARAFEGHVHSDGTEPDIVERLRKEREPMLSLVAERGGAICGHVAFSPVTISDGTTGWFGLGPLSVEPACQHQGIGSALVREGIARLRADGATGCVVLGEPDYYGRFGFAHDPALLFPGVPGPYFQRVVWSGATPQGDVSYSPAFG